MSADQRRPRDLDDLPFTRQQAVRWFTPSELVRASWHVAMAGLFGSYSDKRETQAALPAPPYHDLSKAADGETDLTELWLDYVSDVGDGFDATYSVAYLLGRPALELGDETTTRGSVLVMGGDEVYPTASATAYEDRTRGPYRAALPYSDDPLTLFAVPGNHDWYDGLTSWLRFFCQDQWFGGRRTVQRRSYFAARLPQRWWLLGVDIQLDSYIDGPQVEYFRTVAKEIRPGDGVVLCTAKPAWVDGGRHDPDSFRTLDHLLTRVLGPVGDQVRVMLSGDKHHYARYQEAGGTRQLITCGGGGAYISPTHDHRDPLVLPPPVLHERELAPPAPVQYDLQAVYPREQESRRLMWRVVDRLPVRNPRFALLMAGFSALVSLLVVSGLARDGNRAQAWAALPSTGSLGAPWRSLPLLVTSALVCLAAVGFLKGGKARGRWPALGLLHGAAQLAVVVGVTQLAGVLPGDGTASWWARWAFAAVVGGALTTLLFGLYLALCGQVGWHLNEVFSAQSIEDRRSFLRLHVTPAGDLRIHPVAVPEVARAWHVPASDDRAAPWVEPRQPIAVELVEPPVTVPREPAAPTVPGPRSRADLPQGVPQ